jgi:hypothetical protein
VPLELFGHVMRSIQRTRSDLGNRCTDTAVSASKIHEGPGGRAARRGSKRTNRPYNYACWRTIMRWPVFSPGRSSTTGYPVPVLRSGGPGPGFVIGAGPAHPGFRDRAGLGWAGPARPGFMIGAAQIEGRGADEARRRRRGGAGRGRRDRRDRRRRGNLPSCHRSSAPARRSRRLRLAFKIHGLRSTIRRGSVSDRRADRGTCGSILVDHHRPVSRSPERAVVDIRRAASAVTTCQSCTPGSVGCMLGVGCSAMRSPPVTRQQPRNRAATVCLPAQTGAAGNAVICQAFSGRLAWQGASGETEPVETDVPGDHVVARCRCSFCRCSF